MLDAYSESRRKRATWKVMLEMGEMLKVGFRVAWKARGLTRRLTTPTRWRSCTSPRNRKAARRQTSTPPP